MTKRILALIIGILFLLTISGCADNSVWKNKEFDKKISSEKLKNDCVIAENSKYILKWSSVNCSVNLIEKDSGLLWGTTPTSDGEPLTDKLGMPIKKHPQVESALIVDYLDPSTNLEEQALSYTAAVSKGRVVTKQIKNGVKVEYYFDDSEIMVPVEYILRKDSVSVTVVTKEIEENDKKITSVSLMPFWCSAKNDSKNSYLVFPSGSGALIPTYTLSQTGTKYSSQVYGRDPVMVTDDLDTTEKAVRLPLFGCKSENTGTCAIIEKSAESASIEANVGSSAIKYSGIYAKFQVRGYSSNLASFMNGLEKELNVYSKSMINTDLSVGFYPLKNDQANYSGMADVYKEYLKNKNSLRSISDDISLNITFIGGINIDKSFLGLPYKGILPVTSVAEVKNILEEISKKCAIHINARLLGFGSDGLEGGDYAGGYKVNKKLGSLKELLSLSSFCKNNKIDLYFDFDIMQLKNNNSGYNKYFDVSYSALGKIADLYKYNVATRSRIDDTKYNLLKRELLKDSANRLNNKITKWNISGISFKNLSNTAYSDYSNKKSVEYYSKGSMGKDVKKIFEMFSGKYKIASSDANVYAAALSDVIYDVPCCSSKEQIFSQDIPLYQMIFKGFKTMSSDSMNLVVDSKIQMLKAIESGIGLGFTVTANYYNDLIDYKGYEFFGSKYDDIKESVYKTYLENKDYFNAVKGSQINSHNILDNGLRETVFENGTKVYVNYSDFTVSSSLGEVPPENYVWGGI